MIFGLELKISAVTIVHEAPHQFFLGGSRRMADKFQEKYGDCCPYLADDCPNFRIIVGEDTDYDFYATYTPEVESYLLNSGFEYSPANEYYLDSECTCILGKENVQVVLRTDAEFYKTVFENIDLEVYYHYLWKSSPEKPNRALIGPFFNMLFDIAHATKGV